VAPSDEISRRIKAAREGAGLTQKQVAQAVGIPRTAVVQIEAGRRAVNSLELQKLARLFGREISELVGEGSFAKDPVAALLQAAQRGAQSPGLARELRRLANLAREATRLEEILDLRESRFTPAKYDLASPSSRWEAVRQGKLLAADERRRLGLGDAPAWEIAEIVRGQGVRVAEANLNDDISGASFFRPDTGPVVLIKEKDASPRRLYSCAHEYCHLLADRDRAGVVSRKQNVEELIEVRANAFAAHFLMPEAGVRSFLRSLGKGEQSRQNQEVFGGEESADSVAVQKRIEPGSQDLQVHDAVRLAHHFGTSYEAAVYHLLNLGFLTKEQFEALKSRAGVATKVRRALQLPDMSNKVPWTLAEQVLSLALEALRRGAISRRKVLELARELDVPRREIEQAISEEGGQAEPVGAVIPK
jgi:Zn-dependent peptidase ImmA (M78 family)/DNA-binding XRE family transcriptional regulator